MNDIIISNKSNELTVLDPGQPDQHPALVYLAGLAHGSRRTMQGSLGIIAELLTGFDLSDLAEQEQKQERDALMLTTNWATLRFQHTALIRSQLQEKYSPATANKILSALRGVLKAAWRLGQMNAEDYHRSADIKRVKGDGKDTLPAGRSLTVGELKALLEACASDDTPTGGRDAAIISVLYGCALRRAELISLDLSDFDPNSESFKVKGKGNKQRSVPVTGGVRAALDDWLTVRGNDPGPLFSLIRKGGHIWPTRLTTQAVYYILQERAEQAGVSNVSPHDFRRTFAGDLLDKGADIVTVQKLMGHADVSTTARYDRRGEEVKRKAAELLHVPYVKKPPKE